MAAWSGGSIAAVRMASFAREVPSHAGAECRSRGNVRSRRRATRNPGGESISRARLSASRARRMAGVGFSLLETLRRGSGGLLYGRTLRGYSDRGIFQQYCEGDLCPRLRRS